MLNNTIPRIITTTPHKYDKKLIILGGIVVILLVIFVFMPGGIKGKYLGSVATNATCNTQETKTFSFSDIKAQISSIIPGTKVDISNEKAAIHADKTTMDKVCQKLGYTSSVDYASSKYKNINNENNVTLNWDSTKNNFVYQHLNPFVVTLTCTKTAASCVNTNGVSTSAAPIAPSEPTGVKIESAIVNIGTADQKIGLKLSWNASSTNGGPAIASYGTTCRPKGNGSWTTVQGINANTNSLLSNYIQSNTEYECRIYATNQNGINSPMSNIVSATTGANSGTSNNAAPTKPAGLKLTPLSNGIILSWTASATQEGSSISEYMIECKRTDIASSSWLSFGTHTNVVTETITGLTSNADYDCRVYAVSGSNIKSEASSVVSTRTLSSADTGDITNVSDNSQICNDLAPANSTAQPLVNQIDLATKFPYENTLRDWGFASISSSGDGARLAAVTFPTRGGVGGFLYTSSDSGASWTQQLAVPFEETLNKEKHKGYLSSVASSRDGKYVVTIGGLRTGYNGTDFSVGAEEIIDRRIYTSDNYGAAGSWTLAYRTHYNFVGASDGQMIKVVSSSDGKNLTVLTTKGLLLSNDYGKTWGGGGVHILNSDDVMRNPTDMTTSADGQRIMVLGGGSVTEGTNVYISTNRGVGWAKYLSDKGLEWLSVASSDNGMKLAVLGRKPGDGTPSLYTSSDGGVTWTGQVTPQDNTFWTSIISSADGNNLTLVTGSSSSNQVGSQLASSTDAGITWKITTFSAGEGSWPSVVTSADGNKLLILNNLVTRPAPGILFLTGRLFLVDKSNTQWISSESQTCVVTCDSGYTYNTISNTCQSTAPESSGYAPTTSCDDTTPANSTAQPFMNLIDTSTSFPEESKRNEWWIMSVASSGDGTHLVVTTASYPFPGHIYTSSDSGTTWTQRLTAPTGTTLNTGGYAEVRGEYSYDTAGVFQDVASSRDGRHLVAIAGVRMGYFSIDYKPLTTQYIYTSDDYGVTWTLSYRTFYGNSSSYEMKKVTSSADGKNLTVLTQFNLLLSDDYGKTWRVGGFRTLNDTTEAFGAESIATSADGQHIIVAGSESMEGKQYASVYISTNRGKTWAHYKPGTSTRWFSVAASDDGTHIFMLGNSGYVGGKWISALYVSSDGGNSWAEQTIPSDISWVSIFSSADGSNLTMVDNSALPNKEVVFHIASSIDSGTTWTVGGVPASLGGVLFKIVGSSDGKKLLISNEIDNRSGGVPPAGRIYLVDKTKGQWIDSVSQNCTVTCDTGYEYDGVAGTCKALTPVLPSAPLESICTGTAPSDATLCTGDNTGLTGDATNILVNTCTSTDKCEYTCSTGYHKDANRCVANVYICTGTAPSDATLCTGDNTGLTTDGTNTLVNTCTSTDKCEYTCSTGYHKDANRCVANVYICTGTAPSDATLCTGDNTGLTGDATNILVNTCTSTDKCEYTCSTGYHKDANTCVANVYNCSGTVPGNSTLCMGDTMGLTTESANTLVNTCTSTAKCEYTCSTGYHNVSGVCIDSTAPTVLTVTSPKTTGLYGTGTIIPIFIKFSEAVTVIGIPTLTLDTGTIPTLVNYKSGSLSDTLLFEYTVSTGDTSSDLSYVDTHSLILPTGVIIKDTDGNNAILNLPALDATSSLQSNATTIAIDTTKPATPVRPVVVEKSGVTTLAWGTIVDVGVNNSIEFTVACMPGETVRLYNNLSFLSTTLCNGVTSVTIPLNLSQEEALYSISATITDPAGNISDISPTVMIMKDDSGQYNAPGTPDLVALFDLGSSATDNMTSETRPEFTVACLSGSTVTLYNGTNTTPIGTGSCIADTAMITVSPALTAGTYSISAKQSSAAGVASPASSPLEVTIDITPLNITMSKASDQPDPSTSPSLKFLVTLSQPIDTNSFICSDVTVTNGICTSITTLTPTTYIINVTALTANTVRATIYSGRIQTVAGNQNTDSTGTNTIVYGLGAAPIIVSEPKCVPRDVEELAFDTCKPVGGDDLFNSYKYLACLSILPEKKSCNDAGCTLKAKRQELIYIGARIRGIPLEGSTYDCQNSYTDTVKGVPSWVCEVAEKSQMIDMISSTNKTFRPLDTMTRAEAYVVLMKSICIFKESKGNIWQTEVAKTALEYGFTVRSVATFDPNKPILRQELWILASRLAQWGNKHPGNCEALPDKLVCQ